MHLLIVRHAESVGNREYRIQGRYDYPLSEQGVEQAHALGQFLADESWKPTHIYTSPLQRAVHTTAILRDYWATRDTVATPISNPNLQEIKNGVLEGLTWAEAQLQHPQLCETLTNASSWVPIPGAESLKAIRDRAQLVVQSWLMEHHNEDKLWVVSHGGFMQYLLAALLGSDRVWGISMPPTATFEFELDLSQWDITDQQNPFNPLLWKIHRFNDTQHLNPIDLAQDYYSGDCLVQ